MTATINAPRDPRVSWTSRIALALVLGLITLQVCCSEQALPLIN